MPAPRCAWPWVPSPRCSIPPDTVPDRVPRPLVRPSVSRKPNRHFARNEPPASGGLRKSPQTTEPACTLPAAICAETMPGAYEPDRIELLEGSRHPGLRAVRVAARCCQAISRRAGSVPPEASRITGGTVQSIALGQPDRKPTCSRIAACAGKNAEADGRANSGRRRNAKFRASMKATSRATGRGGHNSGHGRMSGTNQAKGRRPHPGGHDFACPDVDGIAGRIPPGGGVNMFLRQWALGGSPVLPPFRASAPESPAWRMQRRSGAIPLFPSLRSPAPGWKAGCPRA